jgi:hypothetical protein
VLLRSNGAVDVGKHRLAIALVGDASARTAPKISDAPDEEHHSLHTAASSRRRRRRLPRHPAPGPRGKPHRPSGASAFAFRPGRFSSLLWRPNAIPRRRGANRWRASRRFPHPPSPGLLPGECDRAASRYGVTAVPRPQLSRGSGGTAASPRRCTSRAARGQPHRARYCFSMRRPTPRARTDRSGSAIRVIGSRKDDMSKACVRGVAVGLVAGSRPSVSNDAG